MRRVPVYVSEVIYADGNGKMQSLMEIFDSEREAADFVHSDSTYALLLKDPRSKADYWEM